MMIVILGNMGTGKTSVANELVESLKLPHTSIDLVRYSVFSRTPRLRADMDEKEKNEILEKESDWERESKKTLIHEILNHRDIVLETLGVSPIYAEIIQRYKEKYPEEKILAFSLFAPLYILEKRVLDRAKKQGFVPVPQSWKCEWGNCFMSDEDCLIYSLKWAQKLPTHFDPYIISKWNSNRYSSKEITKKIVKYIKR